MYSFYQVHTKSLREIKGIATTPFSPFGSKKNVDQVHIMPRVVGKTICRTAARRLVNKALQIRKECAGSLLQSIRSVKGFEIKGSEDFGEGCHTASS